MNLLGNLEIIGIVITVIMFIIPFLFSSIRKHNFSEIVFSENTRMFRFIVKTLIQSIILSSGLMFFVMANDFTGFKDLISIQGEANYTVFVLMINFAIGFFVFIATVTSILNYVINKHYFKLLWESIIVFYYGIRTSGYKKRYRKSRVEENWYYYIIRYLLIPMMIIIVVLLYIVNAPPVVMDIYNAKSALFIQIIGVIYIFIILINRKHYYEDDEWIGISNVYSDVSQIYSNLIFVSMDNDKMYFIHKKNDCFYCLYASSGKTYEFKKEDAKSVREVNQEKVKRLCEHNRKVRKKVKEGSYN